MPSYCGTNAEGQIPDYAAWALVDAYTVEQAACLWVGAEPAANPFTRARGERDRIAAAEQMLSAAIQSGELPADTSANVFASVGNHSKSLVTREALRAFAEKKSQRPAFLFDTLMRQGSDSATGTDETAFSNRLRVGRPREYDWDAFVIEIIRIANTPDGLPEKQSELVKQMLQWCEDTWGKQPAESAAKKKISQIYNTLGLGQKR